MLASVLSLLLLLPPSPASGAVAPVSADTLHCQVRATPEGKRRCTVRVPEGLAVRACTDADRKAGHCDKAGDGKYAAWVVAAGGTTCKISRKRTEWVRKVTLSMNSKTTAGAATCALYVALR